MDQAQRRVAITQYWLKEIKLTMERQLSNENTSTVALGKSLQKYNNRRSQYQEAQQAVLDLAEIDELEATVREFHLFGEEIEDTAVEIEERLIAKQSREPSRSTHSEGTA